MLFLKKGSGRDWHRDRVGDPNDLATDRRTFIAIIKKYKNRNRKKDPFVSSSLSDKLKDAPRIWALVSYSRGLCLKGLMVLFDGGPNGDHERFHRSKGLSR